MTILVPDRQRPEHQATGPIPQSTHNTYYYYGSRLLELATTPEFSRAQRQRKKVEALFAELKNQIGLRRLRLRRLKFVREQL